jgi:DNA-binding NarL/FixJ family response regulator
MDFSKPEEATESVLEERSDVVVKSRRISAAAKTLAVERRLSPREAQILEALGNGSGRKDIAIALGVSPSTVAVLAKRLRSKTGQKSNYELVYLLLERASSFK